MRFIIWLLSHPVWTGVSAIAAIIVLVYGDKLIDHVRAPSSTAVAPPVAPVVQPPHPAPQGDAPQPPASAAPLAAFPTFRDFPEAPEMIIIPEGEFLMGSPDGQGGFDEHPQHKVRIPKFAMSKTEVTNAQWDACFRDNKACPELVRPDWNKEDDHPVVNVSWDDAQKYIGWLNRKRDKSKGGAYRLPTEAEWEYAARAGTTTAYYWGDSETNIATYANCEGAADGYDKTAPVTSFDPNAWGLYDMSGNVWEWTQDCYVDNYKIASQIGAAQSTGECKYRVLRGGSWSLTPLDLRSAVRFRREPDGRSNYFGFRPSQTLN